MTPQTASRAFEGHLDITLSTAGGRVVRVEIASSRPQIAQRLLAGCSADEAPPRIGSLFSLCGQAQRIAAEAAIEAARGVRTDAATARRRRHAVRAERAREHAWRLLLDWPALAGLPAEAAALSALRGEDSDLTGRLDALLEGWLLGEPAAAWLARDLPGLEAWRRSGSAPTARLFSVTDPAGGTARCRLLPPLRRLDRRAVADLAARTLAEPGFCARPAYLGGPAETGPLSRLRRHPFIQERLAGHGRGAALRMFARLVDLAVMAARADAPGSADVRAWGLGADYGAAAVETSRGLLLHVVRLDAGRVAEYRVVAPTEWNFHADGPLAEGLAKLPADARLEAEARVLVQSLDPCVGYTLAIREA